MRRKYREIELFNDTDAKEESFLMAVDQGDNFVYDYILQGEEMVVLDLYEFPVGKMEDGKDVQIGFEATGNKSYYTWKNGRLYIECGQNETCTVKLSKDNAYTTFTVSNPGSTKIAWIKFLRSIDKANIDVRYLLMTITDIFEHKINLIMGE